MPEGKKKKRSTVEIAPLLLLYRLREVAFPNEIEKQPLILKSCEYRFSLQVESLPRLTVRKERGVCERLSKIRMANDRVV
jgi:hypothetical protein